MRVAVTGGTGFVGAHSVAALVRDGHALRLLVEVGDDARRALDSVGVDPDHVEIVSGDVGDPDDVDGLLDGSDAVLHLAGIVGVDDRRETLMWRVNTQATALVLARAVAGGLDPIVHVATYSALFPSPDPVIGPDSPTAEGRSAYGRTKSAADRIARGFQAAGAPVVITYPSSVVGPPVGGRRGVAAEGWAPLLRHGVSVSFDGAMGIVDVRDVADLHAAVMSPGRGPRRFVCGGEMLRFDEVVDLLEEIAGRRIRRIPMSGRMLRGLGRVADAAARITPFPPVFSYEAAWILTEATPTDDTAALEEVGRGWRPARDALRAALAGDVPSGIPGAASGL